MKRIWKRLINSLTRDDLFARVLFFIIGGGFATIGLFALRSLLTGGVTSEPVWLQILAWVVAIFLTIWGTLLFSRCCVPAQSRIARYAEKAVPDPAHVDLDDAAFLLLIVLIPAVILTLLLRLLGVRGSVTPVV